MNKIKSSTDAHNLTEELTEIQKGAGCDEYLGRALDILYWYEDRCEFLEKLCADHEDQILNLQKEMAYEAGNRY